MAKKKKILLVEDYPETLEMIKSFLEAEGYLVVTASDGQHAIERVYADKPELILLDVMMPMLSGIEVCRELKKDKKIAKIPIIIISVKVARKEIEAGFAAGADEYITKPFQIDQLMATVKKYI